MSERALAFVEAWVADHVDADDADGDAAARANALANRCIVDAGLEGIPAAEINDAIDDLTAFMAGAIAEAKEREEHDEDYETDEEARVLVDPQGIQDAEDDALEDEDDEKQ